MRWEAMFADFESRLAAQERSQIEEESWELMEAESAKVKLADRVRANLGRDLWVRMRSGTDLNGKVLSAAPHWVLLGVGSLRSLVMMHGIVSMKVPVQVAPPWGLVESRLGIAYVLRALARNRARVRVVGCGLEISGIVNRAGADHFDIEKILASQDRITVPFAAVETIHTL